MGVRAKGKEFWVQVKGSLKFSDSLMLLKAAADDLGLTYTLLNAVEKEIASGKLEIVLESYAASSVGFYLYFPSKTQVLSKLRAFIDHARASIGDGLV